jgi:hypothetical protein
VAARSRDKRGTERCTEEIQSRTWNLKTRTEEGQKKDLRDRNKDKEGHGGKNKDIEGHGGKNKDMEGKTRTLREKQGQTKEGH